MSHRTEEVPRRDGSHRTQEGEVLGGDGSCVDQGDIYMRDLSFPLNIMQDEEP